MAKHTLNTWWHFNVCLIILWTEDVLRLICWLLLLTLFIMELPRAVYGLGKGPYPYSLSRIYYNNRTWHSFTFPNEDHRNILIMWQSTWVLVMSAFFPPEIRNFRYIKKYIIIFFEIYLTFHFKDCFNKHVWKFDDAGNIAYSSLLKIKPSL